MTYLVRQLLSFDNIISVKVIEKIRGSFEEKVKLDNYPKQISRYRFSGELSEIFLKGGVK